MSELEKNDNRGRNLEKGKRRYDSSQVRYSVSFSSTREHVPRDRALSELGLAEIDAVIITFNLCGEEKVAERVSVGYDVEI